jgi:hypothetical protein
MAGINVVDANVWSCACTRREALPGIHLTLLLDPAK